MTKNLHPRTQNLVFPSPAVSSALPGPSITITWWKRHLQLTTLCSHSLSRNIKSNILKKSEKSKEIGFRRNQNRFYFLRPVYVKV
jgi:hypothetical protein